MQNVTTNREIKELLNGINMGSENERKLQGAIGTVGLVFVDIDVKYQSLL